MSAMPHESHTRPGADWLDHGDFAAGVRAVANYLIEIAPEVEELHARYKRNRALVPGECATCGARVTGDTAEWIRHLQNNHQRDA